MGKRYFNKELTTAELRLMPYIDYLARNSQNIDYERIDEEEKDIVIDWVKSNFITNYEGEGVKFTSKIVFEHFQEISWVAYINYKNESED